MASEITKVGKIRNDESLYPQIVSFVIWDSPRTYRFMKVQGLQSFQAEMCHLNIDGEIELIVELYKGDTIEFEFSNDPNSWVTARVRKRVLFFE